MKTKKLLAKLLTGAMAVSLLCSSALGAASYDSAVSNFAVSGQNYECWSMLTVDSPLFAASAFIQTSDHAALGAGAMAAQARLFKASGSLIASSPKTSSTNGDWFVMAYTQRAGSTEGAAYSQGIVYVGSSFQVTTEATNTYSNASLSAAAQSEPISAYAVTADGKTYGSALLVDVVGKEPDLISAENEEGITGYVLAEELNDPDCGTSIDLYDLNGTVIGDFDVDPIPEYKDLPDEVKAVLDRLEYEYENGIGLYPVNSKGETYGANILGYQPDLIAAVGDDDMDGYVRASDLEAAPPTLKIPSSYPIPLYDSEGNEIGTFTISSGSLTSSEIQSALSRH